MGNIRQIKSVEAANAYLDVLNKELIKLRLEQSQAPDKRAWFVMQDRIAGLTDERRAVQRQLAKLEVIEHEEAKADKIKQTKRFGKVFR